MKAATEFTAWAHRPAPHPPKEQPMTIGIANLHPIIAIVAGVLILIQPKLLNAVVAIYLIITGILELGLLR